MIDFNAIPSALRLPGVYIEFDNSLANHAAPSFKLLYFGQRFTSGTIAANTPVQVASDGDADTYFGRGSQLAEMIKAAKKANRYMDIHAIALDENAAGVAATGKIAFGGPATGSGTLALYIAGKVVQVGVTSGDTADQVATAVAAAITADDTLPVSAAVNATTTSEVDVTCRWKGETGNDIDIRLNYYGETTPAGIAPTITAMANGTGNPDMTNAIAAMGDTWYNWIACASTDAANLTLLETELESRWGPTRQIGCRAFIGFRGNYADTSTFGPTRNSPHVTCMGTNIAPQPPYIWAAVDAVIAAAALSIDPSRPLAGVGGGLVLTGILPPAPGDRWPGSDRNLLLFDGIATNKITDTGTVMIERQITMYQTDAAGIADDSYLDINVPETLERIRFEQRQLFAQKYPRAKLAEDDAAIAPGQSVMQPKLATAELLALYQSQEFKGWVQDYTGYKASIICMVGDGAGGGDRNRLNVQDSPMLVGQYRVHAQQVQFRK